VISEGSCDTEDESNNDENTALITGIKLHFSINSHINQLFKIFIFHSITVFFFVFLTK